MSTPGAAVIWFTGLSGAGKSTLAQGACARLQRLGVPSTVLDGDALRRGLNHDLGFSSADRAEAVRRAAETARLMADAGLVTLAALISPLEAHRRAARHIVAPHRFIEVHVSTPLQVAEARAPKGLYRRARQGELTQFTGVDAPYEMPVAPDLRLDTSGIEAAASIEQLVRWLTGQGVVAARQQER